jgi:LuxR family maltose regulon positive regulatory protein
VSETLLQTKLLIPRLRPNLVARPRLIERLNHGISLGSKLTLVCAPAGYGKTTLTVEWIAELFRESGNRHTAKRPVVWLSLDAADNDPALFFTYLIATIQQINPDVGVDIESTLEPGAAPPIENLLTALVNDITASATRFVLILDDYHIIQEIKVHQALDFLFDHFPQGMHMVIISRTMPPMPLGRLRVQRELSEIREVDLRFSFAETNSFLNDLMGLALASGEVQKLHARTEGWIAGLHLAALALQDRLDKGDVIDAFTGSHRHLIEYLVQEVISRQPEEVTTFLLYTSLMEKFNVPLSNALMPGVNGRKMLDYLERANLFLNSLDDRRDWYRYHALFADFLRQRLRNEQPEIVPKLFTRASHWYEKQGRMDEAIEYAFLGTDLIQAARLLDGIAETLLLVNSEVNKLIGWADRLPLEVRALFPRLCIFHAGALQFEYKLEDAEAILTLVETNLSDSAKLPGNLNMSYVANLVKVTRSYIAGHRGEYEKAIELALLAYETLPESETREVGIVRATLATNLGIMYHFLGQVESAYHFLQIALPLNQRIGLRYPALGCLEYKMKTDFTCGALNRARINGEKGLRWIEEWSYAKGFKRRPARMLAQLRVEMGRLHYEWNNLEQAAWYWKKACKYFELVGSHHRINAYLYLVDLHQALGENEKALRYLGKVERMRLPGEFSMVIIPLYPQIATRNLLISQSQLQLKDLLAEAMEWAQNSGLNPNDEFRYEQEYEYLTLARVFSAGDNNEQAVPLLDRLISSAEGAGRNGQLITYLALQAVAYHSLNDTDQALLILLRALALGKPQGYLRSFVDLGPPMKEVLQIAARQGIATDYVSILLTAFPDNEATSIPLPESWPERGGMDGLVEPLSEREMTILRYLAGEPSNQEIADELFLSVNTVKWYARNIYSKLGVGNRRAAVIKARELEIL